MQHITHIVHAFFMFITPLKFLGYKSTSKQKILFTLLYTLGIIFSRKLYDFLPIPFGTHTILLVILSSVLFKNILKDLTWSKSIYISLTLFIALLVNDAIIIMPIMKLLGVNLEVLGNINLITLVLSNVLNNFTLLLGFAFGYFKNKNKKQLSLS